MPSIASSIQANPRPLISPGCPSAPVNWNTWKRRSAKASWQPGWETAYPGVWWLEHRNALDEIVGRYIEITHVPEILSSQDADIAAGRARLGEQFE